MTANDGELQMHLKVADNLLEDPGYEGLRLCCRIESITKVAPKGWPVSPLLGYRDS